LHQFGCIEIHAGVTNIEKAGRTCAGAPGLRSRSYFGGVGSAGRPVLLSDPVKNEKWKVRGAK
jgi:hypothetical protein